MLLVLEIIAGLFLLGVAAVAVFIAMQPRCQTHKSGAGGQNR